MATHSSILAQEIPWTPQAEEPGGLPSMKSQESSTTKQQPNSLMDVVTRFFVVVVVVFFLAFKFPASSHAFMAAKLFPVSCGSCSSISFSFLRLQNKHLNCSCKSLVLSKQHRSCSIVSFIPQLTGTADLSLRVIAPGPLLAGAGYKTAQWRWADPDPMGFLSCNSRE